MAGKKRSVNGQVKPQTEPALSAQDIAMTDATPLGGQPQPSSSKTASTPSTTAKSQDKDKQQSTSNTHSKTRPRRRKLAKLPNHATISKRPLLHPALPTPFASSQHPKAIYITASTPYIPALKRVRKLLSQIALRHKQSTAAAAAREKPFARSRYPEANGRLEARIVEREIAGEAAKKSNHGNGSNSNSNSSSNSNGNTGTLERGKDGEQVLLKATGRAIPRALEIALYFQAEPDCRVRIDMGSVTAIDDVQVHVPSMDKTTEEDSGEDEKEKEQEEEDEQEDDVPETRLRMLSSVTVGIGLK